MFKKAFIKKNIKCILFFCALVNAHAIKANKHQQKSYTINCTIKGIKGGLAKLVKLDLNTNESIIVDSALIIDGTFSFKGKLESPYLHTIFIKGIKSGIHVFVENNVVDIKADINELDKAIVSGSREDSLHKMYSPAQIFDKKIGLDIIYKHPDYNFSAFVAYYQFQFSKISSDTMKYIVDNFSESVKQSVYYTHLVKLYNTLKDVVVSKPAPLFSMKDTSGNIVELIQFRGKYVLLDFWASWCKPCRAVNPDLVKLYQKYSDKNFTVISISLDKDRIKWINAINTDKLTWTNVSDLKGWSNVSNTYGVKAIPQNFLINPEGIIIEKNIDFVEDQAKLEKLLVK